MWGKNDPEVYLEWEMKIEHVFACHDYTNEKKVMVAALEFSNYVLIWWEIQIVLKDRR